MSKRKWSDQPNGRLTGSLINRSRMYYTYYLGSMRINILYCYRVKLGFIQIYPSYYGRSYSMYLKTSVSVKGKRLLSDK